MNVKTTTLERMTVAAQQIISRELAADFGNTPDVRFVEYAGRELALQLRQHVYGEHLDQRTVRYPATWRDAVKDRLYYWLRHDHWPWGADLMEARWPVKWHEVKIDVTALYPKISMPEERHSIQVAQVRDTSETSQRLWFDAKGRNLLSLIYRLYDEGRTGRAWFTGHKVYRALLNLRDMSNMGYVVTPSYTMGDPPMLGMSLMIDQTVPIGTLELRDKDDRIVGKIYNIG